MKIDNFDRVREHLKFEKPEDFYVVHVMFRVKDLRDESDRECYLSHDETQRLIKSYDIYDLERFDHKRPQMIDLAEKNHARVYIIPSRKNRLVINRAIAKKAIDFIDDPRLRYDHLIRSAVCGCHISDYKWWVLDVDNDTEIIDPHNIGALSRVRLYDIKNDVVSEMAKLVNETKTRSGSEIYELPTKNGCHILTPPFNRSKMQFLGDNLKTDGMTLLYYKEDGGNYESTCNKTSGK